MKTPVLAKALITVGNVSWRGKMATVLVSPATTISIWASASGQRIRLLTVPITSWRPRVAASVMPTAIKPMPRTVGAKYDANNIYLAAMYAETRNMTFYGNDSFGGIANKTQNFEVVAQYQFDDFNLPLRPSVAYLQSKGKDLYAYSRYGDKDLVKYVDVGMTYYFNKNMSTYVDYKINLLDEDDRFYKTAVSRPMISSPSAPVYQF